MLNFECREEKEKYALAIKVQTSVEKLHQVIGESYMSIMAYLKEIGEEPLDAPYTAYYNLDMQNLKVEMGFPISKQLPGKDQIVCISIPEGKYVSCMYKGAYSGMEKAYNEMFKWMSEQGYEQTGIYYEYYYNSPDEVSESELLTKIVMPVK